MRTPYSPLKMYRQLTALMKAGTAHGSMRMSRYTVRPRNFWFSSSARPRPIVKWKKTLTAVQTMVQLSRPRNSSPVRIVM